MGSPRPVAWLLERECRTPDVVLELVLDGDPPSKSRPRLARNGRTYTPAATVQAEQRIAWAARQAGATLDDYQSFGLLAVFHTASWQRRDVDNMLKLVADGLTGVVWADDSQVTEMSARVLRAQDQPRTHVQVYRCLQQSPQQRPCQVCGKSYRVYDSWKDRKYCSRQCSAQAATSKVTLQCMGCGEPVDYALHRASRIKQPFCSERCRRTTLAPELRCDQCGTTFRKPRSQRAGQQVYCSRACSAAARRGRPRATRLA